jgi:fatty acid desaturase
MSRRREIEWPTFILIAIVYGVIGLLAWNHAILPWWIILPVGSYFAALHVSLQHEVLHGHPTGNRWLNEALVFVNPHFWMPYPRYRDVHLIHHNDANLTDPRLDPESYYMLPADWAELPGLKQTLYRINNTLAGRMMLGPAISIVQFWSSDLKAVFRGDNDRAKAWAYHGAAVVLTLWLVAGIAGMPIWQYLLLIAYPGISLSLVRSYCEHQAAEATSERTIIVEASPFWSLLFLNNNLHVAHHERPALAWYKIPEFYRGQRARLLAQNNHYFMRGYGEIFRRYFLQAKEPVPYPHVEWLRDL